MRIDENSNRLGLNGHGQRYAIAASRFNASITDRLLIGARRCLESHGVEPSDILVFEVPGAWELPQTVKKVIEVESPDAVIALGCVIRGETPHFDYVAGQAARGLGELSITVSVPIIFGVLTTDSPAQAEARSAGEQEGNKGWEAALSALEMVQLFRTLDDR